MVKKKEDASPKPKNTPKNVDETLIRNFISLQRVMTDMSLKFDNLANQISKLLALFEISAKNLAKKDFSSDRGGRANKEMMTKLNYLMDQNKIIARGLTLIHETHSSESEEPQSEFINKPKPLNPQYPESNEYHKSLSSGSKDDAPRQKF